MSFHSFFEGISAEEILHDSFLLTLPLATTFRSITKRELLLFRTDKGWGEFSAFAEYDDQEAAYWLNSGLEQAAQMLAPQKRKDIKVNVIVPALSFAKNRSEKSRILDLILDRYDFSQTTEEVTAKIKVAEGLNANISNESFVRLLGDDLTRILEVIKNIENRGVKKIKIRIDANAAWTVLQAYEALLKIAELLEYCTVKMGIEAIFDYAEQPVASLEHMKELKTKLRNSGIKLAADEGIRKNISALEVGKISTDIVREAADVMIIKNAPLGGNASALSSASQIGLDCVVSSALDSTVGLYGAARLAAALPQLEYACGLGTNALYSEDIVRQPHFLSKNRGKIPLKVTLSDHVPVPDMDIVRKYETQGQRKKWWHERVRRILDDN